MARKVLTDEEIEKRLTFESRMYLMPSGERRVLREMNAAWRRFDYVVENVRCLTPERIINIAEMEYQRENSMGTFNITLRRVVERFAKTRRSEIGQNIARRTAWIAEQRTRLARYDNLAKSHFNAASIGMSG